jgi:hypothetical protein
LDRCGEIDAVELCQHIFPVFAPAYAIVTNADGSIGGAHSSGGDSSTVLTSAFAATSKATATTVTAASGTDAMNHLAAVACDVSDTVWSAAPDAVMVHDESKQELDTTAYDHHLH